MQSEVQFIELFQQKRNLIYYILNYYCKDERYKEDLYQDVALNAWKSYSNFKGNCTFDTWIARIARNVAISHIRSFYVKRIKPIANHNIFYDIEDIQYTERQMPAFDRLTPTERKTLDMRINGLSYAEISNITGESINRITVRMHRIKNMLAKSIQHET